MEQKRKYQRFPVALSATLFGAGNAPGICLKYRSPEPDIR